MRFIPLRIVPRDGGEQVVFVRKGVRNSVHILPHLFVFQLDKSGQDRGSGDHVDGGAQPHQCHDHDQQRFSA